MSNVAEYDHYGLTATGSIRRRGSKAEEILSIKNEKLILKDIYKAVRDMVDSFEAS